MPPSTLKNWQKKMANNFSYHETVMANEAVDGLHIKKLANYIDATAGNGGHMAKILEMGGNALGIDLDPAMIQIAERRLNDAYPAPIRSGPHFKLIKGNFTDIDAIAAENNWTPVSGILLDLGVSNIHLKDDRRGFSFGNPDAVLDMRIDPTTQGVKACDLLNVLREDQLEKLFGATMERGPAKWLSRKIIFFRGRNQISTVGDMLELAKDLKTGKSGLNEATLPFLALRIAVNSELSNLEEVLPKAFNLLEHGGRLVVISFHSGEDSIVKNFFKRCESEGSITVTPKPIYASEEEVENNKRSRSARLRILEK